MIEITGTARFTPEGLRGPVASPSRAFVLGDPKTGTVYGCVFALKGCEAIEPGTTGEAVVRVVGDALPTWPEPWPIWSGRVVGELSAIHRTDDTQ